jgi:hypothetical protein
MSTCSRLIRNSLLYCIPKTCAVSRRERDKEERVKEKEKIIRGK